MKKLIAFLLLLCSCAAETTTIETKQETPTDPQPSYDSSYDNNTDGEDYNTIVNCYWQQFVFNNVVYRRRICLKPDLFPWKNLPDPPPDMKIKQHENR